MNTSQHQTIQETPILTLEGVLASALPDGIGTDGGPARYTIPAVFSRRPFPRELELIKDFGIAGRLAEAGYPGVELEVSDRRLLILNTNLDELKSGLASLVGGVLRELSEQTLRERHAEEDELDALGRREESRREEIRQAAAEIHFH